jgi:hypothetical protein
MEKDKVPAGKKRTSRTTSPKKLTAILLAAGGVVLLGIIGVLLLGNVLPTNLFQPTPQISLTADPAKTASLDEKPANTASPTVSPTQTPIPTPTSTPTPDWVKEVANPILALIAAQNPNVIGDDFNGDEGWEFSPAPEAQNCDDPDDAVKEISDGTMKLSIVSCRVADLRYPVHHLTNFVLQMEVNYHNNPLGLEFRFWNRSPLVDGGNMGFNILRPGGTGLFTIDKINNLGVEFPITAPAHIFDPSKPVTITVINKNPYIIIYMNSTILVAYDKLESYQGPWEMDFTVNSWNVTPTEYLMLELDSVKVWDLDKP